MPQATDPLEMEPAYRRVLAAGGWFGLSGRAVFLLRGGDRVRYLNGQVTANVAALAPGESVAACLLTAKGKLCAPVHVAAGREALRVDAPAELRGAVAERLGRYLIADDVEIEDVTGRVSGAHGWGGGGGRAAGVAGVEAVSSARWGRPGLDLWVDGCDGEALNRACEGFGWEPVSQALLEIFRLEAGLPEWGRELDEGTFPAEAGMDRYAVDFGKGCYVGQEVVSRIRSVGRVNRRLRALAPLGDGILEAGMGLREGAGGVEVGRVTSAGYSFALASGLALGYVRRDVDEARLVAEGAGAEVPVRVLPLPPVPSVEPPPGARDA